MNLTPFRTAIVATSCAVALSFAAVPAYASNAPSAEVGASTQAATLDTTTPTDEPTDEPTADPTDEPTAEPTDDPTDAPTPPPVTAMPPEKGHPKQAFTDATLEPKVITKHGLHVVYTGLTAHAAYQPVYSTGESGGPIGNERKADGKGRLVINYHFGKSEKAFVALGATYTIGLMGVDTTLTLTKTIEVRYDSDLVWHAPKRHGKTVELSASVDRSGADSKDKAWKKVVVHFQKQVGTTWVTVKSDRTDAKGFAKVRVRSGVEVWRAVVGSSATVSGSTSKGHKK